MYDFSKCRLLIFFKVTLFRKITKKSGIPSVWIQIKSNVFWALFARNVKPDLDPKLLLVDTSRWRVNRLLHFCGILFALTMYALNGHGFFPSIRCNNFGMVHYIYIEGSQLIIAKFHFFLCATLFHTCSKQCRPWWNASFRLGLYYLANGTHLCPISMNGSSIIVRKKYLLDRYPPKSILLSIFIISVW